MSEQDDGFLARIEGCLDEEYALILDGEFGKINRLNDEKIKLLARIPAIRPGEDPLRRVLEKAGRTRNLLAAAIRGVRTVTARLNVLREGDCALGTYDRTGRRLMGGRGKNALEWRA
jgi:hypothetical protein